MYCVPSRSSFMLSPYEKSKVHSSYRDSFTVWLFKQTFTLWRKKWWYFSKFQVSRCSEESRREKKLLFHFFGIVSKIKFLWRLLMFAGLQMQSVLGPLYRSASVINASPLKSGSELHPMAQQGLDKYVNVCLSWWGLKYSLRAVFLFLLKWWVQLCSPLHPCHCAAFPGPKVQHKEALC